MNLHRLISLISLGSLVILLTHCNLSEIPDLDNTYLPNYEGRIAIILGKDTITIGEFIREISDDSSAVQDGEDQALFFMYEDSTQFSIGEDFIDIGSFTNSKNIESPISFTFIPPNDTVIRIEQTLDFKYGTENGEIIDSVFYNSGVFELNFSSNFPGDIVYSISTNSFVNTQSGNDIRIQSVLNYSGITPINEIKSIQLSKYKTILTSQSDSSVFKVNVAAAIQINAGTTLTGNESLNVSLDIIDPTFDQIYGYFGKDTFDIESQEISFDIFSAFSNSGLSFNNPKISFDFKNSFGVPAGLDFSKVYAGYDNQSDQFLTGSFASTLQLIEAPSIQNVGSSATSSIELNANNSNIADLLSSSPTSFHFQLSGITNPETAAKNFLLDASNISIKSTIQIPLSIQLNQLEYETDFDLGDLSQLENSEELTINLKTYNYLPFDGELDLIFIDENEIGLDSIKSIQILKSPDQFDNIGKATNSAENTASIVLDSNKINALVNSAKIKLRTRFSSFGLAQNEFVKIFSDYTLTTVISVEGKVSINLNE